MCCLRCDSAGGKSLKPLRPTAPTGGLKATAQALQHAMMASVSDASGYNPGGRQGRDSVQHQTASLKCLVSDGHNAQAERWGPCARQQSTLSASVDGPNIQSCWQGNKSPSRDGAAARAGHGAACSAMMAFRCHKGSGQAKMHTAQCLCKDGWEPPLQALCLHQSLHSTPCTSLAVS